MIVTHVLRSVLDKHHNRLNRNSALTFGSVVIMMLTYTVTKAQFLLVWLPTPLFMGAESCEKSESLQTFFATFLMYALYGLSLIHI